MNGAANAGVEPTITVDSVSKWFGDVVSVNDVSLEVRPGLTGLLGPNGAGKTTLLRMICGLTRPSGGEIRVLGEPVRNNSELYRRIGVMPEHQSTYDFMTGRKFVELNARLQGVPDIRDAANRAIEQVDMMAAADRRIGAYSRGMKQRMRLASIMVHDPEILLLDEPLSGTDPRQRIEFQELVSRLASEGRTIMISSHILEEVEAVADRILLLVYGKLAASGDYHVIRQKLSERPYVVRVGASDIRTLAAGLISEPSVESISMDGEGHIQVLSRSVRELQLAIPKKAQELGIRLTRVDPLDDSLESVFTYLADR
ncbi:MAG: ABC transporter ATP-binding protein [Chloroflexi bacterium]|nr:ABC transporter ATP-binding protein [Chloroflexota bacterium]MBT4073738.1 ABC transporter ATP-binding protein [Chloroflexota bacterium]MBT4514451.1 ABC transporter ATP-binding protein [Chloroflexota bacterium]MBT6681332.1 ABC transporter ATP-binding protein [Chloroflexota bacterium]